MCVLAVFFFVLGKFQFWGRGIYGLSGCKSVRFIIFFCRSVVVWLLLVGCLPLHVCEDFRAPFIRVPEGDDENVDGRQARFHLLV